LPQPVCVNARLNYFVVEIFNISIFVVGNIQYINICCWKYSIYQYVKFFSNRLKIAQTVAVCSQTPALVFFFKFDSVAMLRVRSKFLLEITF